MASAHLGNDGVTKANTYLYALKVATCITSRHEEANGCSLIPAQMF
jgi:hypothetical protein